MSLLCEILLILVLFAIYLELGNIARFLKRILWQMDGGE